MCSQLLACTSSVLPGAGVHYIAKGMSFLLSKTYHFVRKNLLRMKVLMFIRWGLGDDVLMYPVTGASTDRKPHMWSKDRTKGGKLMLPPLKWFGRMRSRDTVKDYRVFPMKSSTVWIQKIKMCRKCPEKHIYIYIIFKSQLTNILIPFLKKFKVSVNTKPS